MAHLARFTELSDELLRHVILLSASQPTDSTDPLAARRRRIQLESLSLVCRAWRPIAQRALIQPERPVELFHAKQLAPLVGLLSSSCQAIGNLVTALDVELWGETQDYQLVHTIRTCRRLETLALTHVERVRLDQVATGEGERANGLSIVLLSVLADARSFGRSRLALAQAVHPRLCLLPGPSTRSRP